ncbi:MAG: hypothetical protein Q4E32_02630 [Bacteroidales bacterium]|nr:hypothetical protein [Bacteroidales bacterium]
MNKQTLLKQVLVLAILLGCFSGMEAQTSNNAKITQVCQLFEAYRYATGYKSQESAQITNFYNQCSKQQRNDIRSFMVQAITDSLQAEHKEFAMNYIDCYRLIASADDDYLSSLLMTEAKYYYEKMDRDKLGELTYYVELLMSTSPNAGYSEELAELKKMKDEVEYGCERRLAGYWVADCCEIEKAAPFYLYIYKDKTGEYHVDTEYCNLVTTWPNDLWKYTQQTYANYHFQFGDKQESLECIPIEPTALSYYWCSEKLNVPKEELIAVLWGGVRTISNSIVGELARRNSHSAGESILGTTGAMVGEIFLNSIIDVLAVSSKKIRIIQGTITSVDNNNATLSVTMDYIKLNSDSKDITEEQGQFTVNLIRCKWNDTYMRENIAFVDGYVYLRQNRKLSKKERKLIYKGHPEARKLVRRIKLSPYSFVKNKHIREYNRKQIMMIKEYNRTH